MEVDVSLVGLDVAGWFPLVQTTLSAIEPGSPLSIEELFPPPGAFGAGSTDWVKATFTTIVGLAGIVGAGASLYSAKSPRPAACEVSVETGKAKTKMTFDCKTGNPAQLAEAVAKLVAESLVDHTEQHGPPKKVILRPVR